MAWRSAYCYKPRLSRRHRAEYVPLDSEQFVELAGQLGAAYAIPIIYVPVLMITHVVAFYLLLRPQPRAVRALAGDAAASWSLRLRVQKQLKPEEQRLRGTRACTLAMLRAGSVPR